MEPAMLTPYALVRWCGALDGAGGRGVWGRPGDELLEDDLDENDPNYVPDEDADVRGADSAHGAATARGSRRSLAAPQLRRPRDARRTRRSSWTG